MTTGFSIISDSERSIHTQVARKIARNILSGDFAQGSIIPSEVILCEQFGISRTALREAIKLLTSKGLLESRPKIGTKVVQRAYWNFLDPQLIEWMHGLTDSKYFCQQFLGLRRAIEPEACALAAIHATTAQRTDLSTIFQRVCAVASDFKRQDWIEVDIDFHRHIFNSTGNPFYLPFANILTIMFIHFIEHSSEQGETCLDDHREIYEAIMEGDADRARSASVAHLQENKHRLLTDL